LTFGANQDEIFFIDNNNEIKREYFNGTAWIYDPMSYSYCGPTIGYPCGDKARRGITYDKTVKVIYCGYDGRVQYFGKTGSSWWHAYVDDYWITSEFSTFISTDYGDDNPSIIDAANADGAIYYSGAWQGEIYQGDGGGLTLLREKYNVRCFKYMDCDILNVTDPPTGPGVWANAARTNNDSSSNNKSLPQSNNSNNNAMIYPNPSDGIFRFTQEITQYLNQETTVYVTDITGKTILAQPYTALNDILDLSAFSNGVYIVTLVSNSSTYRQKAVIQKN
jgi:hypothetical protein